MSASSSEYFDELEAFYAHPDIATWKAVLGTELHYHFGFFPDGVKAFNRHAGWPWSRFIAGYQKETQCSMPVVVGVAP